MLLEVWRLLVKMCLEFCKWKSFNNVSNMNKNQFGIFENMNENLFAIFGNMDENHFWNLINSRDYYVINNWNLKPRIRVKVIILLIGNKWQGSSG